MNDADSPRLEAILLAAGRSRRMGGVDKLLLPVEGVPMVRRSANLYRDLGMPLTVVTGPDSRTVAATLAGLDISVVSNPDGEGEQHGSVVAGLTAAPLMAPGVVIALSDQPLLTTADILALVEQFEHHDAARICVPRHGGQRGNPVIFPVAIARLLRRPGAPPPRGYIDAHPEHVAWFDAANDHFIRDIDTHDGAARLLGGRQIGRGSSQPDGETIHETAVNFPKG